MPEPKGPDCLFPEEVEALVRSLKRISKYNNENKRFGTTGAVAHQVIQDEANHWIKLLDFVVTKRRV